MPAGRPSKYDPRHCERVVSLGKEGKSQVQIACDLGVDPKTLRDWAEAHEEFSLALTRAKAEEQSWWENAGQSGLFLDKFNAAVWKKSMEARFREDYTERRELTGKDGGAIATDNTHHGEVAVSHTVAFIAEALGIGEGSAPSEFGED